GNPVSSHPSADPAQYSLSDASANRRSAGNNGSSSPALARAGVMTSCGRSSSGSSQRRWSRANPAALSRFQTTQAPPESRPSISPRSLTAITGRQLLTAAPTLSTSGSVGSGLVEQEGTRPIVDLPVLVQAHQATGQAAEPHEDPAYVAVLT